MRRTQWYAMEICPDYDGSYEVETESGIIHATYVEGSWYGDKSGFLRWRGRRTVLNRFEADELRRALAKRRDSSADRQDAADAAVLLGRAARASAAASGRLVEVKRACKYFHLAVGLGADLQTFDKDFMKEWWPRLRAKPKRELEERVRRFLNGVVPPI